LLIEDEASVSDFISAGLTKQGYQIDLAADGTTGLSLGLGNDYDLIILDLLLPDLDGIEVLRRLRAAGRATRVLVLTCRDKVEDRVKGLETGADDYLAKPFDFGELLARVRALLRRTPLDVSASVLRVGDLELDTRRRYVTRQGRELRLPAKQFAILEHLMRNADQVVTRQDLARHVWPQSATASNNVIDVTVHLLRENVDRGFPVSLIQTVRGVGYQLAATPRLVTPPSVPQYQPVPQGQSSSHPNRAGL
jgi:two-component system copper resistance phosphate regulon response regulator CusR